MKADQSAKTDQRDYHPAYIKRANMAKLLTTSRMAMTHDVMLSIDGGHLKSLSLNRWQGGNRKDAFEMKYAVLGIFRVLPGETRADVYRRLYDEAKSAGAQLGAPESFE